MLGECYVVWLGVIGIIGVVGVIGVHGLVIVGLVGWSACRVLGGWSGGWLGWLVSYGAQHRSVRYHV